MRLPLVDIDPADFALVLLVTPEGEDDPIEIAKIDCRHETVHLHEGANKTDMRDIRSADDIQTGYTEAWDCLIAIADTLD